MKRSGRFFPRHLWVVVLGALMTRALIFSGPALAGDPGTQKWAFTTGSYVMGSSPAIGTDGTIYVGSWDHKLYGINPDGTQKLAFATGGRINSSPSIASDGTIYVGSYDGKLYAINPDGTKKWAFTIGNTSYSAPAIGADGTVYVGSDECKFYAISPDGSQKWAFVTGGRVDLSSPAIGADGTIYVGSLNPDGRLYAINPDGTQKWTFNLDVSTDFDSPAIGADGTIYVGTSNPDGKLYAINPDGTKKWQFSTGDIFSSPSIDAYGTIYVGTPYGLYAINPDGTQKWAFVTGSSMWSSPAVGADGTIYVRAEDCDLYAVNPDGTQKWAFFTSGYPVSIQSFPAISADGTVYVGSSDDKLYAVYSSSGGLANSPWPMFHHDVRHSGRSNYIALNIPKPTATPPLNTFPAPANLFVESGSFIKNHGPSFSAPSQQFLNDNQNALNRFISKFITSKDGFKASANLWKNVFTELGNALSAGAICADAKESIIKGINSLLLHVEKDYLFNILHMDNDSQIRAYFDVLTHSGVPTNGYSFVFFAGSVFSELYTGMFSLIADDPPDPNFTEVFQCPVAISSSFYLPGVSQDMNGLLGLQFGSSYNTYYYLLGLTTSINRYSSALAAGDAINAGLQFEAFVKYLTLYDSSAIQQAELTRQFKQALLNQGSSDVSYNKQDLLDLQNHIMLNGLPSEVINSLKTLGLTDSQISDLKQAALNYVPPESVSGSLYSNLSNGVDLLHNASSWRPFNPALLYLMLND